jgi:hypothetical protein
VNCEFARAGAEEIAAHSHVVAEIEQPIQIKALLADGIFFYVDLEPLALLLEVGEPGFAHQAYRHNASGSADVDARVLQFLGSFGRVLGQDLRDGMG